MASKVKKYFIFFLVTTLSVSLQTNARESHFFNKVSSSSNEQSPSTVIPQQQEPSFTLETENAHGLSGHESGQLPPSSTAFNVQKSHSAAGEEIPNKKYLPKNYNPVAYVTVVEDKTGDSTAAAAGETLKDQQYYTGAKGSNFPTDDTSLVGEEVSIDAAGKSKFSADDAMFDDKEFTPATAADNYHYSSAEKESFPENEFPTAASAEGNGYYLPNQKSSMPKDDFTETDFNTLQQEETFPTTAGAGETRFNYNHGVSGNRVQQQGMSDTRFLENGKYFYDINAEKYVRSPFENAKDYLAGKSRNQFNNNNDFMESNFQDVEEFPEEENLP